MDCSQIIRARRSVRKYKADQPVPQADIEKMLEAAMMAPSARNLRPWEFFVVEDAVLKDKLRQAHPFASMLGSAPVAILVCALPDVQKGVCEGMFPLDCGAAIENLLLQAVELGYGTCWCGCWPHEDRARAIQDLMGIQSLPVGLVAVGVPDEDPKARGFYDPAKVTWLRG